MTFCISSEGGVTKKKGKNLEERFCDIIHSIENGQPFQMHALANKLGWEDKRVHDIVHPLICLGIVVPSATLYENEGGRHDINNNKRPKQHSHYQQNNPRSLHNIPHIVPTANPIPAPPSCYCHYPHQHTPPPAFLLHPPPVSCHSMLPRPFPNPPSIMVPPIQQRDRWHAPTIVQAPLLRHPPPVPTLLQKPPHPTPCYYPHPTPPQVPSPSMQQQRPPQQHPPQQQPQQQGHCYRRPSTIIAQHLPPPAAPTTSTTPPPPPVSPPRIHDGSARTTIRSTTTGGGEEGAEEEEQDEEEEEVPAGATAVVGREEGVGRGKKRGRYGNIYSTGMLACKRSVAAVDILTTYLRRLQPLFQESMVTTTAAAYGDGAAAPRPPPLKVRLLCCPEEAALVKFLGGPEFRQETSIKKTADQLMCCLVWLVVGRTRRANTINTSSSSSGASMPGWMPVQRLMDILGRANEPTKLATTKRRVYDVLAVLKTAGLVVEKRRELCKKGAGFTLADALLHHPLMYRYNIQARGFLPLTDGRQMAAAWGGSGGRGGSSWGRGGARSPAAIATIPPTTTSSSPLATLMTAAGEVL